MTWHRWFSLVCTLAIVLAGLAGPLGAAPPTLTHLTPGGGQRGAKVTVTCHGTFSWPTRVFAPGIKATPSAEKGKIDLEIPSDLPADRVWIRLVSEEGASALVPFVIGNVPEIAEVEPNDTRKTAQVLTRLPVTVNGVLAKEEIDAFAVRLEAGSTLIASVAAHHRLGSPMDAVLQVVNDRGAVVADNHDDVSLDPLLAFAVPVSGVYQVRIFAFPAQPDSSIRFSGGANYVYRLTLTTGGFVDRAAPLAIGAAGQPRVHLQGWNLPPDLMVPVRAWGDTQGYLEKEAHWDFPQPLGASLGFAIDPRHAGSARVRLLPHEAKIGPGEGAQKPTPDKLPLGISGHFRQPHQVDQHRLEVGKGQTVRIRLEARSLGLPTDPVLKLFDEKGKLVATADDTKNWPDAVLERKASESQTWRIAVSDRFGASGPRHLYLLTAQEVQPDFALETQADAWVLPKGKSVEIPITVHRLAGWAGGRITIRAVGLPEGVTAQPAISEPTGPTASKVVLKCEGGKAPVSGPIRIIGEATLPGQTNGSAPVTKTALTPAKLGARFDWGWLTVTGGP